MNRMINQLINLQKEDGAFSDAMNQKSIFITGIVLSCLNELPETDVLKQIKTRALKWILNQRNDHWIFNENLGINFYVLAAISKYNTRIIDGTALAKIITILTSAESQEGGPYYSFIDSADKAIDLGVNVAIAYFLHLQNVRLPELDRLIKHAMESKNFYSSLFNNKYLVIHLAAKFYQGEQGQVLHEELVNEIKSTQASLNSSAVDIALYLEALEIIRRFNIQAVVKNQGQEKINLNKEERHIMDIILDTAEKRFSGLCGEMKNFAMSRMNKTIKVNSDKQMSLMPLYMKQALGEKGKKISDPLVAEMGLANIFYWTAFIIYDNFWDEDEEADPRTLPIANLYARHYSNFFTSILPHRTGFNEFFTKLMDELDSANLWETIYCRTTVKENKFIIPEVLPEYGNYNLKYQPASGHVLGPVAMLYFLGYNEDSQEVKNLIAYFKNYLIGMQINDDAHDWEEDMERGHLSTVVVILLQYFKQKFPQRREIDLKKDKEQLQQIFWFKTISQACKIAIDHANKSKQALKAMTILENPAPMEHYITITKNVAEKALFEHKNSVKFLQEFKG